MMKKQIVVLALCLGLSLATQEVQQLEQQTTAEVAVSAEKTSEDKDICSSYYSCSTCTTQSSCGWCASTSTCSSGSSSGPLNYYCSSWKWTSTYCTSDSCSYYSSCSSCTSTSSCGWCSSSQTCSTGSSSGPSAGYCSTDSWKYTYSSCSSCSCSIYDATYTTCPAGYSKSSKWCESSSEDVCCGSIFDCCTMEPWLIAMSCISPTLIFATCILACCSCCAGCPIYNARLRRRQAMAAAYQPHAATTVTTVPTARAQVVATTSQPPAFSPILPVQQEYASVQVVDSSNNTINTPLVAKC